MERSAGPGINTILSLLDIVRLAVCRMVMKVWEHNDRGSQGLQREREGARKFFAASEKRWEKCPRVRREAVTLKARVEGERVRGCRGHGGQRWSQWEAGR